MRIVVFHYHLLPGGVTDVIVHSLRAIATHRDDVRSITLVTGRRENTESVLARLADLGTDVELSIEPDLDYTDPTESRAEATARAERLEKRLLAAHGHGTFWWVHNHHLGKNPAFTLALCRIAALDSAPQMLLHVHDFPECARYENLAYLRPIAPTPYPAGSTVRYAVINERDREAITAAGVPADRVGLLLNPVPEESGTPVDPVPRPELMRRLAKWARHMGYTFSGEGALLLYPIRAIRRKNVLETALLSRLASDSDLVVTLPGRSDQEVAYSDLVDFAFRDGRVAGVFGVGADPDSRIAFGELTHGCDLVLSSSVQEGFGLTFVDALRWRRPLVSRRLDVTSGIDSLFEGYPAGFYESIRVPMRSPSVTSMQIYLRMRYQERLDAIERIPGSLSPQVRDRLDAEIDDMLDGETIDFSFLPAQLQLTVLGDLAEEGFAALVRALNAEVVSAVEHPAPDAPSRSQQIESLLGYEAYAKAFARLVDSHASPFTSGALDGTMDALVDSFARLDRVRLVLGPLDHGHEH